MLELHNAVESEKGKVAEVDEVPEVCKVVLLLASNLDDLEHQPPYRVTNTDVQPLRRFVTLTFSIILYVLDFHRVNQRQEVRKEEDQQVK